MAIRAGRHPTYDRLVFQFAALPGISTVSYVGQVDDDPRGDPIPLQGHAFLRVVFHDAFMWTAWDPGPWHFTYTGSCTLTTHLPAIQQVKCAGDFEGYLSFGIGVAHRAGFRIFTLQDPARVVIDVAST